MCILLGLGVNIAVVLISCIKMMNWINVACVLLPQVVQGLVVGKLSKHCTERTLLRLGVLVFAGVGLGMVRLGVKSSTVPFSNMAGRGLAATTAAGSATAGSAGQGSGGTSSPGPLCKHGCVQQR